MVNTGIRLAACVLFFPVLTFARPRDRADFSNAFVRVTVDAGRVAPGGENGFRVLDAGKQPVAVVIEARKGWTLVSPKSGVALLSPGEKVRYRVRSVLGEDEGEGDGENHEHEFPKHEEDVHIADPVYAPSAEAGGPYLFTPPRQAGAAVHVSGQMSCTPGTHRITTTYDPCECGEPPPQAQTVTEYDNPPDEWRCEWKFDTTRKTNRSSSFSDEFGMSRTGSHSLLASFRATDACPQCSSGWKTIVTSCMVYSLTVESPAWIGQDRTDGETALPTATARAVVKPHLPPGGSLKWSLTGVCSATGGDTGDTFTFGPTDREAHSLGYLQDELTLSLLGTPSGSVMTNFTVVKLDVSVAETGEDDEESVGAFAPDCKDVWEYLSLADKERVSRQVEIRCYPDNLPDSESIGISGFNQCLFERGENTYRAASSSYPARQISTLHFVLVGCTDSKSIRDKVMTINHPASTAKDLAKATIYDLIHITEFPSFANRDYHRLTVGVGEKVKFSVTPIDAGWNLTSDRGTFVQNRDTMPSFIAPFVSSSATVTLNYVATPVTNVRFVVKSPTATYTNLSGTNDIPANLAGAEMYIEVQLLADDVCFNNVDIMEVGMVSTDATGFFADPTRTDPSVLDHSQQGANVWRPVSQENCIQDYAGLPGIGPPWYAGAFSWQIPAKWRCRNDPQLAEHGVPWSDQFFEIDAYGTVTVRKFGHVVTRTVDGNYTQAQ